MSTSVTRPSKLYCFNRGVWPGEEANYPPAWHALPLHYLEFSHYCPLSTWHWNMASVLFVNTTVFSRTVKRTLLPWTIQEVPEPNYTFADFFTSVLRPKLPSSSHVSPTDDTAFSNWSWSLVGPSKRRYPVDPNEETCDIQWFPHLDDFWRYEVTTTSDTQCTVEGVPQNAFDVLMESARQMYLQQNETGNLQQRLSQRETGSISYIMTSLSNWHLNGLSFKADEVDTSGFAKPGSLAMRHTLAYWLQ